MHHITRIWTRAAILISILVLLAFSVAAFGIYRLSVPYKEYEGSSKVVEIPHGTRIVSIADLLEREGIINHRNVFLVAFSIERRRALIRAGEYSFDRPMSGFEVIQKLLKGEILYRTVTIPEGSNMFDIAGILQTAGVCDQDAFLAAAHDTQLIKDLAPDAVSLEGYLFPDTYKFEKGTPSIEVAKKMVDRFRHFLSEDYLAATRSQGMTLNQAVILASLIEKETGQADERPLVSAVFHNRLLRHQRLECDPTVIYAALVSNRYRGKIYRSDLEFDSPFNTYLRAGLPLGAIANPGRASLEAAVSPAPVNYLYFVSDNNERHVFSTTLAQHQRAVQQYRRAIANENSLAARSSSSASKQPRTKK